MEEYILLVLWYSSSITCQSGMYSLCDPRDSHWCAFSAGPGRAQGICYWGGRWFCAQGCPSNWALCHQGWGKYLNLKVFCDSLSSETMMSFAILFPWYAKFLCSRVGNQVIWIYHAYGQSPSWTVGLVSSRWVHHRRVVCSSQTSACRQNKAAKSSLMEYFSALASMEQWPLVHEDLL